MSSKLERELEGVLAKLEPDDRKLVLEYARSLALRDRGRANASLRDLVGTISGDDLQIMRETVEEIRSGAWRRADCS